MWCLREIFSLFDPLKILININQKNNHGSFPKSVLVESLPCIRLSLCLCIEESRTLDMAAQGIGSGSSFLRDIIRS